MCTCQPGYVGDPFTECRQPLPPRKTEYTNLSAKLNNRSWPFYIAKDEPKDLCNPSPCGFNAICSNGTCSCIPEYQGDPYNGCRPECVVNSECPHDKACIRSKCVDPCPGVCGQEALCDVHYHLPMCSCPPGYTGDAFVLCRIAESMNQQENPNFKKKKQIFKKCTL